MSAASLLLLLSTSFASAVPARVETPLNVRSGEGTQFPVVATMPAGAVVDASNCGDGWCYIAEYGGFASASYLNIAGADYGSAGVYVEPAPSVVVPWAGYREPYYDDGFYGSYGSSGYYEPYGYRYAPGQRIIRHGIREFDRELRRDFRDDWRQSRQEWRQDRRDAWQDRREARQERRQDRLEARQERREDRVEARQERREQRERR
jgi:uncharacterized protein YraI